MQKNRIIAAAIVATLFWAVTLTPRAAALEEPSPEPLPVSASDWDRLSPRQYLFLRYPDNAGIIDRIIRCESGWKPDAQNAHSTAYGLAQFLDGTHRSTVQRMALVDGDGHLRRDAHFQVDETAWLYEHDGGVHWTESANCWKR